MILIDGEKGCVEIEGGYLDIMSEILTLIEILVDNKAFKKKDIKIIIDILKEI